MRTSDKTGFIVNRLLVPYLLDAIRAYEEGVGSIEDIDNAMKLGCGYPMGPFTLLDFVGLDTTYYITHVMYDEFKERRFASPPLLKRMVMAGWYGRKSGRGFYDYADPEKPKANEALATDLRGFSRISVAFVILGGVFCREGPIQVACAGKVHRFFASLRMTSAFLIP